MHEMNRMLLPASQLRYILDEELQHDYTKSNDIIDILNARVQFSILAGAKMQVRRNMAQSLPLLTQSLFNPEFNQQLAVQGMKLNVMELFRMWMEASEWKNQNDLIVPMSPQDQQRWQQMQPAAQAQGKLQAASAMQDKKFEQQQQLADQENVARAARDVLRQTFEKATAPEALTGEPGATEGFGSEA